MANKLPEIEIEEIKIKVPWGHVAAKWWGPKNVRPIVALHGWQDNAGTFDTLIPLLPRHLSYLAIDFPGHGLSSPIPFGWTYSTYIYVNTINFIWQELGWQKISLMGHSMGSHVGFCYTSHFPDRCDLMIALDIVTFLILPSNAVANYYRTAADKNYMYMKWNDNNSEPPNYSYDELIERLIVGSSNSVNRETAPYILNRSVKASPKNPNRYYFSRDTRVKHIIIPVLSNEVCIEMAGRITNKPYLIVKGRQSGYRPNKPGFYKFINIMKETNDKVELYEVNGKHHFHLTDPLNASDIISTFLLKNHTIDEVQTKL